MFELVLNGKIELESPDEFFKELQELFKKYNTTFHGQNAIYKLPEYVDYQRVEIEEIGDTNVQ